VDGEGDVRVHVLVASNALYGRMVNSGVILSRTDGEGSRPDGRCNGLSEGDSSPSSRLGMTLKVASAEDLALLLTMAEDEESRRALEMLIRLPEFDRCAYNRRLVSIGLPQMVVAE
jgi:hypothetical protein